jgi:2-isopropylmalate synthase
LTANAFYVQGRTAQRSFAASAAHEDVVVGSARAYVNALNKLMDWTKSQQVAKPAHQAVSV